jgi:DNA sulfur modification protein DndC
MNLDTIAQMEVSEVKHAQPTLFEGIRQTMTEAFGFTAESLNIFAVNYDHWVMAYSGGKDSSLLVTLVMQLIANGNVTAPKSLTVLYADTRMELPPLQNSAMAVMDRLRELGCDCRVVLPKMEDRFFVYMFGRGVPPPSNTFRWCTSQIKIEPMMAALADLRAKAGQKLLMLTGVRIGESAQRDARISLSCGKNGAECGQGWFQTTTPEHVADTLAPILHWRVCHVWKWLRFWAPQGGFPTERVADAYGGVEAEEINARTGCVGCNLASKDTALETLLQDPRWEYLRPLTELRKVYAELKKPHMRLRKPTGERTKSGKLSKNQNRMGPLTMDARQWGLAAVLDIQDRVNVGARAAGDPEYSLINEEERAAIIAMIEARIWPQKWRGDEPVATAPFEEMDSDGTIQGSLLRGLE